jgi:hypothetical protein
MVTAPTQKWPGERAGDVVGGIAPLLHHIDLAALRPPYCIDVVPEHPERPPQLPAPEGSFIRATTRPSNPKQPLL